MNLLLEKNYGQEENAPPTAITNKQIQE